MDSSNLRIYSSRRLDYLQHPRTTPQGAFSARKAKDNSGFSIQEQALYGSYEPLPNDNYVNLLFQIFTTAVTIIWLGIVSDV